MAGDRVYQPRASPRDTRKARLLAREGCHFTILATVRGLPGQTDADAKHHVTLQLARLGQKLERAGHDYIGFVAYEKFNGLLHGQRRCMSYLNAYLWQGHGRTGSIRAKSILTKLSRASNATPARLFTQTSCTF